MIKELGEKPRGEYAHIPPPSIFSSPSLPQWRNHLFLHVVSPQTPPPIFPNPPLTQSTSPNRETALLQTKSSGKIKTPPICDTENGSPISCHERFAVKGCMMGLQQWLCGVGYVKTNAITGGPTFTHQKGLFSQEWYRVPVQKVNCQKFIACKCSSF